MPQTRNHALISVDSRRIELQTLPPRTRRMRARVTEPTTITVDSPSNSGENLIAHEIPWEAIAREAYFRFQARGGEHGHDVEDWLAAEASLRR